MTKMMNHYGVKTPTSEPIHYMCQPRQPKRWATHFGTVAGRILRTRRASWVRDGLADSPPYGVHIRIAKVGSHRRVPDALRGGPSAVARIDQLHVGRRQSPGVSDAH